MERLACKLITWMIDMQAITEEDRELYEYAAYSFFITMAPLMLVILFGSFMGFLVESILFIIPFMAIRKFSGGYHMKSPITCFVISCFLLLFCIILSYNLIYDRKVIIVLLISSISLMIFSPIDSENRRLDWQERKHYKKTVCVFTIVFVLLSFVFACMRQYTLAGCIAIGIVLTSGLQLPCIIIGTYRVLKRKR